MIAIVDYGAGNPASVARALEALGYPGRITADPTEVGAAEKVILPGVGHFGALMAALDARGLRAVLQRVLAGGRPFLGICIGLQVLYEGSEEAPGCPGLGVWPGMVRRFPAGPKVPHTGWAEVTGLRPSRLLAGCGLEPSFYFTHAYFVPPDARTTYVGHYPGAFIAAAEADAIFGVQFHPEKSAALGRLVLENFVTLPRAAAVAIPPRPHPRTEPYRRIIPCLDVHAGRVVKGVQFAALRDSGDPAALAAAYDAAGADELALLDISASREGRNTLLETVAAVARQLRIPLLAGGGVASLADGERLLAAGADKVTVNTAAALQPRLVTQLAQAFGSQAVVVAVDARRDGAAWRVFTHGGHHATERDAVEWAREAESLGAGEILLTSMDRDGTREGFDTALSAAVSAAVQIPVIASGGGGQAGDFAAVLQPGGADAALAASIFHTGDLSPLGLKQHLAAAGVPVRMA
ncbi:MAG: imidazole glycerol phosphate synthase subunit HisF [Terriglobales bacterium]